MKFKKQRDEEERLERAAKIKAHIAKQAGVTKATPPTFDDEPLSWSQESEGATKVEIEGTPKTEPKPVQPSIYPPLRPWERLGEPLAVVNSSDR